MAARAGVSENVGVEASRYVMHAVVVVVNFLLDDVLLFLNVFFFYSR